jgi:hypothetical protein
VSLGDVTARYGMALCGYPVEDLAIVPELSWDDVGAGSRCPQCASDSTAS